MPTADGSGFDAILIQATDAQIYEIDSFEIHRRDGTTIQTAGATTTFCSADIVPARVLDHCWTLKASGRQRRP